MSQSKPVKLSPLASAFAGALGGCFSTGIVYPLDVVKTRIQATSSGKRRDKLTLVSVLMQILKDEGFSGLYRGFGATMLNTFSMQYAYFFFYSFVRNAYIRRLSAKLPKGSKAPALSTLAELALGALAGALAQICTLPVAVIATRQQIGKSLDKARRLSSSSNASSRRPSNASSNGDLDRADLISNATSDDAFEEYDDSFFGVAREIVDEEGISGLWLGIRPGLVLTVNPAITYGVYERVKNIMLIAKEKATGAASGAGQKLDPWMTFLIGAMSKTLATVVTYPYIMAKIRIQARSADLEDAKEEHLPKPKPHQPHHAHGHAHVGALDILGRVWRKEGMLGWYQGMGAQITKAVISQALLFLSKEQFEHWTLALIVILYRLRGIKA